MENLEILLEFIGKSQSGSLAFIRPEKINSKPTLILQNHIKLFFILRPV
jgi:hypothetical protein